MIWVDITNLPHVLFFKKFIKSHETLVTTRDFGELNSVLDSHGIGHVSVGRHGGKSPEDKLLESSRRIEKLTGVVAKKIDIAVSKQSVELPRVAFGLDIPVIQFIDNEYAEKQNRVVLPLCRRIIVPLHLDKEILMGQGASRSQILEVNSLFEASQVKNFVPDSQVPEAHGLKDYVVIRPEPGMASYFKGRKITEDLIERLRDTFQIVVLSRGEKEYREKTLRNIDSLSLMYYAKAVLGGGGTMTREAALLGTPSISYYPLDMLGVDRFLIDEGLLYHSVQADEAARLLEDIVNKKQKFRKTAKKVINRMEDPFKALENEINNLTGQPS